MITLTSTILETCKNIKNGRSELDVIEFVREEFEELQVEVVAIIEGTEPGPDGIVGEAIDLIINCFDMILLSNPGITEADLISIANKKLTKWVNQDKEQSGC